MNRSVQSRLDDFFKSHPSKFYKPGEIITLANQEPAGVSLLISGFVEQYDITPEGNKLIVNIYKPSTFFPMSWAINKTPNAYFFGAVTQTELKQAESSQTVNFLKNNPDIMFDLLSRVYKGTDAVLRRLVLAASGIAANRLIFELLIEAYRFGEETNDDKHVIRIKQSVLAARSGLARETVSRELYKLVQENLISRAGHLILLDIKNLEHKLNIDI